MAELINPSRPVWVVLRVAADVVLRWALWMGATAFGCVAGVVFVFAVYGTYGARVGIFTTLAVGGLALAGLVAWGLHRLNSPRHGARHPRGNR